MNIGNLCASYHISHCISTSNVQQLEKDTPKNGMLAWLKVVEVVSVERTSDTTCRVVYRFPVQREYLNPGMTLHGGMSAGIYDVGTTWTLNVIRKPGFWMTFGTSRSLNVTFIRPAVEGEMLRMECEVSLPCLLSALKCIPDEA